MCSFMSQGSHERDVGSLSSASSVSPSVSSAVAKVFSYALLPQTFSVLKVIIREEASRAYGSEWSSLSLSWAAKLLAGTQVQPSVGVCLGLGI